MASITNLGSVSGLPLEKILSDLQTAEDKKLSIYTTRAESYKTRIDAYAQLQSALEALQKSAGVLGKTETMAAIKGSVTGGNALTATVAAEGAVAGQYTITVNNLARAQSLQSGAVADRTAKHGDTGSFEIELADGTKRTIDLKGDTSLNGIVKAINADDKSGLRATVINDGNGNNYLMLTAKDTGVQASVKNITVTGDQSLKDILSFSTAADGTTTGMANTKAEDAEVVINGITVKSGSNNVSKAIDGVTLNLTEKTEAGKPITLKLESDTSVANKAIQDFVKTYNALQTTIKNLTAFDAKAATNQPLTGDGTTRSIQSSVTNALQAVLGEGTVRSLADLGITTDPQTRQLKLDQTKLDKALTGNPADVTKLLTGEHGLAKNFEAAFKDVLGSTGSLKTRTDGLAKTMSDLDAQQKRAKAASDAEIDQMRTRFVALDKFYMQMQTTANYLTQQFAAMNKSSK
ncbi:flagellar filament capping protein FliD [Achromobacter xylosoxidans]|jgi:flagellar hook-associated protein 2|uniref:Flagellar hook-associated protein 2 n=1 Tax=Alcaligenes xylosoxydans xylosoxydans TaxID=85698 RepID=A0A9W5A9F6_ALCXX|nr:MULTISPECIES: flagellar filament capping protein FliD [Achromobacter]AXA77456.1 flagellar hook protein FliD [Achromobacter xylosoxidans]EFV86482.1 flagellar hook-associated protein 2 [Achromobacter xylosoxidans C54]MCH4577672.1 flagellar filament capping protein FliD [Achromobacter xylosoxidans]MCZ8388122.1 flagellar filament capping protein FliD [Achromobacter xylosoxidans]MCZ8406013.1 flagellar filament capping protein FliD [Achromobacter xylosoxidans]